MCIRDRQTPARESLDGEFVHNSAYDPPQDEIDISAENAEKSDSKKYVLEDLKCNSPKLLLGEEKFYDKVYKSSQMRPERVLLIKDLEFLSVFSSSM